MNKKMKYLLLTLCVCIFGLMMTGCASETTTTIKVKSATKADFSIQVGYDDELLSTIAAMRETTTKELIKELKSELKGSDAVYAKKTINGITYHTFTASAKNIKMTDVEMLLETSGYTNVCLTKDFFYATFDPDQVANNLSSIAGLNSKVAELQANDDYDISDFQFFMKTSVTMKSKVKTTNGKLSNKSKTVKWTIKDASKKKNIYASTAKTTKTAKATAVKNNKSYKAGKKITVSNSKSLVKMKLDGKAVKKNTVVKKKGTHTLTIWSKNGKVQNVTFTIK